LKKLINELLDVAVGVGPFGKGDNIGKSSGIISETGLYSCELIIIKKYIKILLLR
jgi:hypothetical protein